MKIWFFCIPGLPHWPIFIENTVTVCLLQNVYLVICDKSSSRPNAARTKKRPNIQHGYAIQNNYFIYRLYVFLSDVMKNLVIAQFYPETQHVSSDSWYFLSLN